MNWIDNTIIEHLVLEYTLNKTLKIVQLKQQLFQQSNISYGIN